VPEVHTRAGPHTAGWQWVGGWLGWCAAGFR
jgi:hypothetical protein